jgi:glycosyltransferase involved in cell wall biosynthesis
MAELISVGVPVYRGEAFVAETLKSIKQQTHQELDVLISVDGNDAASAVACEPFLRDTRFRLVIQEHHLGWVENANFLMAQNTTAFWCLHPQDDLLSPNYFEVLLEHARANRDAAVTYCDIKAFGEREITLRQPSVVGTPALRELILLKAHHAAVAIRGLTRRDALQQARALRANEAESFSADTTWMASIARSGELHRLPTLLYFKRYHRSNTHMSWMNWSIERRMLAWQVHCRDMFLEATQANATLLERRLMWCTALARLVSDVARSYLPADGFEGDRRLLMLTGFLKRCQAHANEVEGSLEKPWSEVEALSHEFFVR